MQYTQDELMHFGVKGMKWGHRKHRVDGVPNSTAKAAFKDAHEMANAKMYYGEGAGTRRKLIKNKVEGNAKRDPAYKKAFDHHMSNINMADAAATAKRQRKGKDAKNAAGRGVKHVKGVIGLATGTAMTTTAAAAAIYTGYTYASKMGLDKKVAKYASTGMSDVKRYVAGRKIQQQFKNGMF